MFNTEIASKASPKAEFTGRKILDAALELFRSKGFEEATMREIAAAAGVATGAAYYYYPSKDSIVLSFYQRSWNEMQPRLDAAIVKAGNRLEERLEALIEVKLEYFAAYRGVLRALLKNGADPAHPLSPFGDNNRTIREADAEWFARVLNESGLKLPKDLAPHMPEVLWMFQMGVIYFWITDDSPAEERTTRLLAAGVKIVSALLKMAALPLTRPLRKVAIELIETVKRN